MSADLQERVRITGFLTIGALVGLAVWFAAGWLVESFTFLPVSGKVAITSALYVISVYVLVFDTNESGEAVVDRLFGAREGES